MFVSMEDYEYYCSEYISGVRIYFKSSREYIIYDVSIEVLDDDDYKGEKAGVWTVEVGLYQWRTTCE